MLSSSFSSPLYDKGTRLGQPRGLARRTVETLRWIEINLNNSSRPSEMRQGGIFNLKKAQRNTVVVFDDDPVVLMAASMLLSENGFSVFAHNNAVEAMAKRKDANVSAVLTDVMMPGRTGLEFLDVIRS